jgi:hypothetical protein
MAQNLQEVFGSVGTPGVGASDERKAVGLMMWKGMGFNEQVGRMLVENKDIGTHQVGEVKKTRENIEELNKGFNSMYGVTKDLLNVMNRGVKELQTISSKIGGVTF